MLLTGMQGPQALPTSGPKPTPVASPRYTPNPFMGQPRGPMVRPTVGGPGPQPQAMPTTQQAIVSALRSRFRR